MLVILGAVLALMAGRQVASLFAADEGFLPVSATVLRARVSPMNTVALNTPDVNRSADVSRRKGIGPSARSTEAHRVYQELLYFVNGKRYSASLDRGQYESRAAALAALAHTESSGTQISVWANANDPAQVVLQPVQREAGAGAITVFALLGMFALQLGSTLVRSASNTAGSPATSPSPISSRPITIH